MYNTFYLIYSVGMNLQKLFIGTVMNNYKMVKEKTTKIKTSLSNQIQKYELDIKAFEWFLYFMNQTNEIVIFFDRIYESNLKIKNIVDSTVYSFKYIFCIISNQRILPFQKNWICTSILMKQSSKFIDEEYYYNDFYEYIDTNESINTLKESCDSLSSIVSDTDNVFEGMVTMKFDNQYINRVFFNTTKPTLFDIALQLVPSKHQFISIKYSHPRMKEPIFIDIDKEYYYAYNEVLSPLFIKRYLEYQPLYYYFDMNYELEIMDNDINTFKMTSKQYILLVESTYTIKNIE
jgi:hypothetical protein